MNLALSSYKALDRGLFEVVGPFGAARALMGLAGSRLFGIFGLGNLSLYLGATLFGMSCITGGIAPLGAIIGLIMGVILISKNNNAQGSPSRTCRFDSGRVLAHGAFAPGDLRSKDCVYGLGKKFIVLTCHLLLIFLRILLYLFLPSVLLGQLFSWLNEMTSLS